MPRDHEAMPQRNGPGFSSWDCHICGIAANQGWRTRCRICEAYPKPGARRPLGGGAKGKGGKGGDESSKGQGKGKGADGKGGNGGKGGDGVGAYAARQLQLQRTHQARAAHRSSERELADARRRNNALLEDVQRLQQELAETKKKKPSADDDDDEMDTHAPGDYSEDDRKARMEKIRSSLPYLEEHFGSDSSVYLEAVGELDVHQKALREAKPYRTHRTILERKVDKLRKQQEKDNERLAELKEAADEIKVKISTAITTIEDRDREIEAAEAELRDLVLRAVGEDTAGPQQPAMDPTAGWNSVIQTVGRLANQPGVPEHFTAQLDGLFGQLQYMVSMLSTHAAAAGTTPGLGGTTDGRTYAEAAAASSSASGAKGAILGGEEVDALGPRLPPGDTEELRQRQRQAWRQRKQTAVINNFIEAYRTEQQQQQPPQQHASHDADETAIGEPPLPQPPAPTAAAAATGAADDGSTAPRTAAAEADTAATAAPATATSGGTSASSGQTPPAQDAAANDDVEDFESDITGTLSETERDNMDIETVVSKVPADQKASVRAILEVRRARTAKRLQRLKKPAADDAAAARAPRRK